MTADIPLSPQEAALFRSLVKPAAVYLLMLRLGRPTGAREVAGILGIHEQTAAKYLRMLSRLNLVVRGARKNGYRVLRGRRLLLGEGDQSLPHLQREPSPGIEIADEDPVDPAPMGISQNLAHIVKNSKYPIPARTLEISQMPSGIAEKSQDPPHILRNAQNSVGSGGSKNSQYQAHTTKNSQNPVNTIITTGINLINHLNDSVVVIGFKDSDAGKKSQNGAESGCAEIWRELRAAGICANRRTQALARLPHITPEYVRAHRLKLEEGGRGGPRWTGLLITILERGDPAPALNPAGHLASCKCQDCHRYSIAKSWGEFGTYDESSADSP